MVKNKLELTDEEILYLRRMIHEDKRAKIREKRDIEAQMAADNELGGWCGQD